MEMLLRPLLVKIELPLQILVKKFYESRRCEGRWVSVMEIGVVEKAEKEEFLQGKALH